MEPIEKRLKDRPPDELPKQQQKQRLLEHQKAEIQLQQQLLDQERLELEMQKLELRQQQIDLEQQRVALKQRELEFRIQMLQLGETKSDDGEEKVQLRKKESGLQIPSEQEQSKNLEQGLKQEHDLDQNLEQVSKQKRELGLNHLNLVGHNNSEAQPMPAPTMHQQNKKKKTYKVLIDPDNKPSKSLTNDSDEKIKLSGTNSDPKILQEKALEQEPERKPENDLDRKSEQENVQLRTASLFKTANIKTDQLFGESSNQSLQLQDQRQAENDEAIMLAEQQPPSFVKSVVQQYKAAVAKKPKKKKVKKSKAVAVANPEENSSNNGTNEENKQGIEKLEKSGRKKEKHAEKKEEEILHDENKKIEQQRKDEANQRKLAITSIHRQLSSGKMIRSGKIMQLFLDQVDGEFFLLDGDSLLMEAAGTVGWRFGQQLHLFYIAESLLRLLSDHGGCCWASFVEDVGKSAWRDQPMMQLFRRAFQLHLQASCSVQVVSGIEFSWDPKFLNLLKKRPQFLLVHDGHSSSSVTNASATLLETRLQLRLMAYCTLAHNIPIVFISDMFQMDLKLHGLWIERRREYKNSELLFQNLLKYRPRIEVSCSDPDEIEMENSCNGGTGPDVEGSRMEPRTGENPLNAENSATEKGEAMHNDEAVGNAANNSIRKEMRESSSYSPGEKQLLRDWLAVQTAQTAAEEFPDNLELPSLRCLYFASLSVLTYDDRVRLVDEDKSQKRKSSADNSPDDGYEGEAEMHEASESLNQLASSILTALSSLTDLSGFSDPHSVSDLVDVFVFQTFGERWREALLSLRVHPRAKLIIDRYDFYVSQLKRSVRLLNMPLLRTQKSNESRFLHVVRSEESQRPTLRTVCGNRLVDEFTGELLKSLSSKALIVTADTDGKASVSMRRLYDERKHWHNHKPLNDDMDASNKTSKPNKQQWKNFDMQNHLRMYGASLHSERSETIIVQKSAPTPVAKPQMLVKTFNKSKLKYQWQMMKLKLRSMTPEKAITKALQAIEIFSYPDRIFEAPVMFLMNLQYQQWKSCCTGDEDNSKSYSVLADLIDTLHKYCSKPAVRLISQDLRATIARYFVMVGFSDAKIVTDFGLKKLQYVKLDARCICPMSYQEFQMLHMGHLMQRNVRFDPDPRVKGFIPDTWQRELLDVVDRRESAVIVAPTSSGKTFCSYYCMKKVLAMSDEDIVVYVAPTKALVNQVHASLNAKFCKPRLSQGKEVCGVFTRDYTYMVDNCQILITVPQCLEILLMSPRRQGFANRIQYVIFDEVHCIGTNIGGVVWEYLICLIRCPFLALSATIRNREYFHEWLKTVKHFTQRQDEAKGAVGASYKVNLVTYSERYSDIRTSLYLPSSDSIAEVNPCVFLRANLLRKNGFPNNLKLSPKESHQLWSAAMECFKDDQQVLAALRRLRPEAFFDRLPISRTRFRDYEVELKGILTDLLKASPLTKSQDLLLALEPANYLTGEDLSNVDVYLNFPTFVEKLRAEDRLPALVFMNNRNGTKILAESILGHLMGMMATAGIFTLSPTVQDVTFQDLFARRRELAEFAFFTPASLDCPRVEEVFLKVVSKIEEENVKMMLVLGFGYHHAGCAAKHRQAVEMLFRFGYLRVVTSTSTLALGIHMPCKTVVFAADDKYLDALNYHQMSGRSGRRGFDKVGDVVFYGVPAHKISHLIHADLPELRGGFPMTCAFALRLLLLTGNATDPEMAHARAITVLNHPFAGHDRRNVMEQLKLYFLFSVDFLIRQEFINKKGLPQELAGLVCHIGYQLPGNFVLAHLLRTNAFRELCKPCQAVTTVRNTAATTAQGQFSNLTMRTLLLILARLFTDYPLPKALVEMIRTEPETYLSERNRNASKLSERCDSMIMLDPLPEAIEEAVDKYNEQTVDTYINYLKCVTGSGLLNFSKKLPVSGASPLGDEDASKWCSGFSAVSPLTRLSVGSGIADAEDVLREALLSSDNRDQLRRVLPLEILTDGCLIPMLPTRRLQNAFALDFFIHGSTQKLIEENGLKKGDEWSLLQDFLLVIKAVTTVLEQLAVDKKDPVVLAFRQLALEYKAKFEIAFRVRLDWRW